MLEKGLSIDELLISKAFRKRPGMYMGESSITALYFFLNGIFHSLINFDLDEEFSRDLWMKRDFSIWIAKRFGWKESTAGWKNMILEENSGHEKQALENFFELYDEFRIQ